MRTLQARVRTTKAHGNLRQPSARATATGVDSIQPRAEASGTAARTIQKCVREIETGSGEGIQGRVFGGRRAKIAPALIIARAAVLGSGALPAQRMFTVSIWTG